MTYQKLNSKDVKGNTMTYSGIMKLRSNLVLENNPANKELIDFYTRKLTETFEKFYSKNKHSL